MKNKQRLLIVLILLATGLFQSAFSQDRVDFDSSLKKIQYGLSTKLVIDFDPHFDNRARKNYTNMRLGVAGGIGYNLSSTNTASLNLEYSGLIGGLGTYNNRNSSYFVIAPHFCQSLDKGRFTMDDLSLNNQPLYYFTDLVTPPLQNLFLKSVSVGANFVHFFNIRMSHKWQRIAHLGFKINEVQLVYNNDGGAILKYWGDKEDRYFTGCGFLRVRLQENLAINDIAISFYKFTGFDEMSFETSDELLLNSVDYRNTNQAFFNRGFWSFQIGNSKYGDVFVRVNNPRNTKEFQNFIHYHMGFGYHQNPTDKFYTFGTSLTYYNTKIATP